LARYLSTSPDFRDRPFLQTSIRFGVFTEVIDMSHRPNKSPEPTAVGAGRSAVAVHVASRRWLSFFR
jgi:hypothetical protein